MYEQFEEHVEGPIDRPQRSLPAFIFLGGEKAVGVSCWYCEGESGIDQAK